jgi:hypothetical protein
LHITKVQQWVASTLVLVVGLTPAIALSLVSVWMTEEPGMRDNAIGLWVMSAVWAAATIAGVLLIHRRSVLSAWLVLALVPPAAAAPFLF